MGFFTYIFIPLLLFLSTYKKSSHVLKQGWIIKRVVFTTNLESILACFFPAHSFNRSQWSTWQRCMNSRNTFLLITLYYCFRSMSSMQTMRANQLSITHTTIQAMHVAIFFSASHCFPLILWTATTGQKLSLLYFEISCICENRVW